MTTIDNLMTEMESLKAKVDRPKLVRTLFEYALTVADLNGYKPTESYMDFIIEDKMKTMVGHLKYTYDQGRYALVTLHVPSVEESKKYAREEFRRYRWGVAHEHKLQLTAPK
jgi:hypothetical protein